MKRILIVCPSLTVKGGISTFVKGYLSTDIMKRYRIDVVCSHIEGKWVGKFGTALLGLLRTLVCFLSGSVDVMHIHCGDMPSAYRKFFFFVLAGVFGCKRIIHLHGAMFMSQYECACSLGKRMVDTLFERGNQVICLSASWAESVKRIVPKSKVIVLYNAVRLPPSGESVARHTMQQGEICLTFLGSIGERKGVFILLEAFKRLVQDGCDVVLRIGGDGDIERLKRQISLGGIGERVEYLGWLSEEDKNNLLRETDIFVLPSYGEGMPMSILEAMAFGIPVISTRVGGIPEMVRESEAGILVAPGDVEGLERAMRVLVENRELRKKLGMAGRALVEERHNIEVNWKKLAEIYESL